MTNPTCSVAGCTTTKPGKPLRKGLCQSHYDKQRYHGHLGPHEHKTCTAVCLVCGESFTAKSASAKYCTSKCRSRRPAVMGLTCFICSEPMIKGRTSKPQGEAAHDACRLTIHGKTGYNRGCRCETCCEGKANYMREWHDDFKSRNGVTWTTVWRKDFSKKNGYRPSPSGSDWISPKLRRELYERDSWTCYLCSGEVDRWGDSNGDHAPSLDHLTPRSAGGTDDPENLRTCCRVCNSRKGARLVSI